MTLEEKEYQLQLSKKNKVVLPEVTRNSDKTVDGEGLIAPDVTMVTAVRYRKDTNGRLSDEDESSSLEDHSVDEAIEMVSIKPETILLPSQLKDHKKVCHSKHLSDDSL